MLKTLMKRLVLVASAGLLVACQTVQTTRSGLVGIDRKQSMSVSADAMNKAADQQYAQVLEEQRKKNALNRNAAQVRRVRDIAHRLIPQTAVFRQDAPAWKWEVNVITADDVNAWCMPGGKIAVYTGLIEKLKITDDELAAVMGHEIAHALREHSRERASEQAVAGTLINLGAAVLGIGDAGKQGAAYAYQGLVGLPNSRQNETEADRIGIELAARAGYDPQAAITLWEKMASVGGGNTPQFLSTHPSNKDRINDLRDYAHRVMPLYQQSMARRR